MSLIEEARSSRATCRTCKQKIEKGALRYGEETINAFSSDGDSSFFWHHLACAAARMPVEVKAALEGFGGLIPDREKIEAILASPPKAASKGGAKAAYPYAERASTSRSKCLQCNATIERGTMRVAVEREVTTASFTTTGPGYLHPACAVEYSGEKALLDRIKANMPGLSGEDLAVLEAEL